LPRRTRNCDSGSGSAVWRMAKRWLTLYISELTPAQHERLAESLWQVEATLRALCPARPSEKRTATLGANFIAQMRRELREQYGEVYLAGEADVDMDVWGECIEGLEF
jgi:hypothetical protein